jgi:hypothetical protein
VLVSDLNSLQLGAKGELHGPGDDPKVLGIDYTGKRTESFAPSSG